MNRRDIIERNLRDPDRRKDIRVYGWWIFFLGATDVAYGTRWFGFGIAISGAVIVIAEGTIAGAWLARREKRQQKSTAGPG